MKVPGGLFLLASVVVVTACGQRKDLLGPETGVLRILVTTSGSDLDGDGYMVRMDDEDGTSIGLNSELPLPRVPAGTHSVELAGIAANCSVDENPRSITVVEDETTILDFRVSCAALGAPGGLVVQTSTQGNLPDPDGYTVTIDSEAGRSAELNGELSIEALTPGEHVVRLSGLAGNCVVDGENPRIVAVTAGGTARTILTIACWSRPTGRIAFENSSGLMLIGGDGTGLLDLTAAYAERGYALELVSDPAWLPDGRRLTVVTPEGIDIIHADVTADTPAPMPLPVEDAGCPGWSPDGRRMLFTQRVFLGQGEDVEEVRSIDLQTGEQRTILVMPDTILSLGCPSLSPDGRRIAIGTVQREGPLTDITVIDADGSNPTSVLGGWPEGTIWDVTWAPDGSRLAFEFYRAGREGEIYVVTLATRDTVSVTRGRVDRPRSPSWSPDGGWIAFEGEFRIFVVSPDGTGLSQLTIPMEIDGNPAWGIEP